jgi:hypothetical protein
VVDLVDDGADSLVDVKRKLELAKSHSDVLEKELAHLKAENTRLRAGGSNASSAPMAATEASGRFAIPRGVFFVLRSENFLAQLCCWPEPRSTIPGGETQKRI